MGPDGWDFDDDYYRRYGSGMDDFVRDDDPITDPEIVNKYLNKWVLFQKWADRDKEWRVGRVVKLTWRQQGFEAAKGGAGRPMRKNDSDMSIEFEILNEDGQTCCAINYKGWRRLSLGVIYIWDDQPTEKQVEWVKEKVEEMDI